MKTQTILESSLLYVGIYMYVCMCACICLAVPTMINNYNCEVITAKTNSLRLPPSSALVKSFIYNIFCALDINF